MGEKCCGNFKNVESGICKAGNETIQFLASIRISKICDLFWRFQMLKTTVDGKKSSECESSEGTCP